MYFASECDLWHEVQQVGAHCLHLLLSREGKDPEQLCGSSETKEMEER